uniref:Immunoglobulin I-set domain-containing protein n=1 Tax=Anopheles coluzzii TaxID=1518534 RepID=A0A8W7PRA2_ANOCL
MWQGEMIISNERYLMNENESSMYAVQMTLVIRKLHKSDMGGYKCISKNSIGDAEGTIRLYDDSSSIIVQHTQELVKLNERRQRASMHVPSCRTGFIREDSARHTCRQRGSICLILVDV